MPTSFANRFGNVDRTRKLDPVAVLGRTADRAELAVLRHRLQRCDRERQNLIQILPEAASRSNTRQSLTLESASSDTGAVFEFCSTERTPPISPSPSGNQELSPELQQVYFRSPSEEAQVRLLLLANGDQCSALYQQVAELSAQVQMNEETCQLQTVSEELQRFSANARKRFKKLLQRLLSLKRATGEDDAIGAEADLYAVSME
ncbi:hypothetical protein HDU84_006522 [Entophlyctis sp. JEL0112]|nr:hypothetical protein HDU84_006522 [Entophlyctis sp. JEL0112]